MLYLLAIPFILAMTLVRGLVLTVLWAWFAVPAFHAPLLTIPEAIGLAAIVGYIALPATPRKPKQTQTDRDADMLHYAVQAATGPFIALAFGWVVHLFM